MPAQKTAFLFPGQGAQYPGIGRDLHAAHQTARDTYAEASDALGIDIAALSFAASAEQLALTRNTQPVLLTHSVACLRVLQHRVGAACNATFAAGHSLGEYAALVAADALAFADAVRLVRRRGELMGEFGRGEMLALLLELDAAADLAGRHHCQVAACNLPKQNVIGGDAADLDALLAEMKKLHPRARATRLKTEGAFHTYYMVEAAMRFREELSAVALQPPRFAVASNYAGNFHGDDPAAIKSHLFLQLFNPVRWHENLLRLREAGAELLLEFGGGLGKGDDPAAMRPNLEGIVNKTWNADSRPRYSAVINAASLAATEEVLTGDGTDDKRA